MSDSPTDPTTHRISVSLAPDAFDLLEGLVENRKFRNRSHAVSSMIHGFDGRDEIGPEEKAGSITIYYTTTRALTLTSLLECKEKHHDLVLGSHRIWLSESLVMEVILVRGPGTKLISLANSLTACPEVKFGDKVLSFNLGLGAKPRKTAKKGKPRSRRR